MILLESSRRGQILISVILKLVLKDIICLELTGRREKEAVLFCTLLRNEQQLCV